MIGLVTVTQVVRPQAASASVSSGDVIFARDGFSGCTDNTQIARYSGGTETDLSDCSNDDQMPAVSPDGSRIVFQSFGYTDPTLDGLYVMNSDGSGKTQLTQDCSPYDPGDPSNNCTTYYYTDENPSWSPDGTKIVFTRQLSGGNDIDEVNADGSGSVTTLVNGVSSGTYPMTGGDTSWSPGGTEILYTDGTTSAELYEVNPSTDATSLVLDASTAGSDYDPVWSPNGSKIYFDNGNDIWGVNADGTGLTQLTYSYWYGGQNYEPTVSPDGSTITYANVGYLYTVSSTANMATGTSLTTDYNNDMEPAYALKSWPQSEPSNSAVAINTPSPSDAPYTRQITIGLSTSGVGSFQYGWSSSNTTAPNTSYLQSTTDLTHEKGTLNYLGVYSGSGSIWNGGTTPDANWYLWVRSVQTGGTPNSWAAPLPVHTPKAPVWVGVGDSYSSGWHQDTDESWCPTAADAYLYPTEPACAIDGAPHVTPYDNSFSWLSAAWGGFDSTLNVPSAWHIYLVNVAVGGASTSSFGVPSATPGTDAWASGGTQADEMRAELYQRPLSWNVVSMTGGGIDAGLHSILQSWYNNYWNDLTGKSPWNLTSGSDCPDSETMYTNLTTGSPTGNTTIIANLQGIVDVAAGTDPGVRVLSVGYPEVLDASNVCQGDRDSGTTKGFQSVITQLNNDHNSGLSGSNVKYVDLVSALGTTPITSGDIQETRLYGYPHPSSTGQALIAEEAVDVVAGSG